MDKEKAKQFDEMIRQKRHTQIKVMAAISFVFVLGWIFVYVPFGLSTSDMGKGTVLSWSRAPNDIGNGPFIIWAKLPGGSKITVNASRYGRSPFIGERIGIVKVKSLFRGTRYRWKR